MNFVLLNDFNIQCNNCGKIIRVDKDSLEVLHLRKHFVHLAHFPAVVCTATVANQAVGFVEEQNRLRFFGILEHLADILFGIAYVTVQQVARLLDNELAVERSRKMFCKFGLAGTRRPVKEHIQAIGAVALFHLFPPGIKSVHHLQNLGHIGVGIERIEQITRRTAFLVAVHVFQVQLQKFRLRLGNGTHALHGVNVATRHDKTLGARNSQRNATRRIIQTVTAMTEAELLAQELQATDGNRRSTYLQIIDGKTACLFATACALGNPECYDLGLCYGRLFQLYDDIADGEATVETDTLIAAEMPRWNTLADQWPGIVAQLPSYDCNKTAQTNTK